MKPPLDPEEDAHTGEIVWRPAPDVWASSKLGRFAARHQPSVGEDYGALWRWSVEEPDAFWGAVWTDLGLGPVPTPVLGAPAMPGATWFEGATLNYAEHLLTRNGLGDDARAIDAWSQSRGRSTLTMGELRDDVRRAAAGLRRLGVKRGDRVAALMPNIPETIVAFLATASIGAIWSSCAPEFGVRGILDRWAQVEPVVLIAVDGYRYGTKGISISAVVDTLVDSLPSLRHTVALAYLDDASAGRAGSIPWADLTAETPEPLTFEPVGFAHPLYILSSSGTTGRPKQIVHGHGGILLEHGKQLALHHDLGPGDRFFWFSTTGWMMWNYLVSGLTVGATVVLFDGDPGAPDLSTLWSVVDESDVTVAGFSAPFIMSCRGADLRPRERFDLRHLRAVGSTGAPLPEAGYHWVADAVGRVPVWSISGGTDVCSAFVGGAPVLPVRAGAITCRQLGWKVESFGPDGHTVTGVDGELVITTPAPSMPVGFWGDADGARYRSSYFAAFEGVWWHGDWISIFDDGSCVISGRSDATLNRGGVRLGTADMYAVLEDDPDVVDSLVVHLEDPGGGLGMLVVFVVLRGEVVLTDDVVGRLRSSLRTELSPRHAPDQVHAAPSVPRTLSGKKLEVPVKRILQGAAADDVASPSALQDPTSLRFFEEHPIRTNG